MSNTVTLDGNSLNLAEIFDVAHSSKQVEIDPKAAKKVERARGWISEIVEKGDPVYGVNPGFGIFSNRTINTQDIQALNRNLILSHAVGTGPTLDESTVRVAMLIRANTLAKGNSGNRLELLHSLIAMLNSAVTPIIPSQGSLGSSGDLAPLSHLALVLTRGREDSEKRSGRAIFEGKKLSGKAAMQAAGVDRVELEAKEGLALTNGATFSAAIAALSLLKAKELLTLSEMALAMSMEALCARSAAFDDRLHQSRMHPGQIAVAEHIRKLTKGSTLLDSGPQVQDAYSLRAAAQVQGPAYESLEMVEKIVLREINASTDNPLLFGEGESISGGNFHGEPIAQAMDFLKISFAEIGAISERRIFHLTDGNMNFGLPAMLVADEESAGVNSGVMMLQYTAASLALENQHLANPDSVLSLPTSGGKEDHNANSMTAARNAAQLLENVQRIVLTELYVAARALDLRLQQKPELQPGKAIGDVHKILREEIPFIGEDQIWNNELNYLEMMLLEGKIKVP